ncbi:MAG: capsule assembly Wzi family protein [Muribaculaceae bacterium]|nr:capsule assembly Wzi family protein [Muribaculaceae bacterium]
MMSIEKNSISGFALVSLLAICSALRTSAEVPVEIKASLAIQTSSGSLAPYMLGSWNQGNYAEGSGLWQEAAIRKPLDMKKRFDWSAGAGYIVGKGSDTEYTRWDASTGMWGQSRVGRNAFRITQLFGELKYRATFLNIGMKSEPSRIVDDRLSSGDLVRSNNATPIPGIGVGFLDFVDIPFTKGWVQINGELKYGKMMDSRFKEHEFNMYSGVEALDILYNYKRCYFRTNPDKNFHVTVGMQAAAFFGGSAYTYSKGRLVNVDERGFHIKDLLQAFAPREGGEAYYEGGHLGSWDFKATYRFHNGSRLKAYFEWPWEDGSGIGRMNGWDGLWGLQYDFPSDGIVSKAVVEYLDFTNQGGPIHYAPADHPNSSMTGQASGSDDYYNNGFYGAYTNYGMSIGTPFLVAPIYNRDGMLSYLHNRARGFHVGIEGIPTDRFNYRVMVSHAVAGGSGWYPAFKKSHSTSGLIEGRMRFDKDLRGFEIGVKFAFDKGNLRGDNFGAQVRIAYSGDFSF